MGVVKGAAGERGSAGEAWEMIKAAKVSGGQSEQLKRRQAFQRLQRGLQYSTLMSGAASTAASPSPSSVADAEDPVVAYAPDPQWPPVDATDTTEATQAPPSTSSSPPASPPLPRTAPASHGVAFSLREPMTCEICRKKVTKWLSYRPDDKLCICWDCGVERQERIMRGEKVP